MNNLAMTGSGLFGFSCFFVCMVKIIGVRYLEDLFSSQDVYIPFDFNDKNWYLKKINCNKFLNAPRIQQNHRNRLNYKLSKLILFLDKITKA